MPSAFPVPSAAGPQYTRCQIVDVDFPSIVGPKFYDGGADTFGLPFATTVWEIEYDGLEQSEVATLDAHYASANGIHLSFDFTDPETGITYSVKYLEYKRGSRDRRWINKRVARLIKRP